MNKNNPFDNIEELGFGSSFEDKLCDMLSDTAIFRDFSHDELKKIVHYVHAYRAPEGVKLIQEGDKGNYLCIIIRGKVNIHKEDVESELKHLAVIREGATLGEISFIDNFPHSATATTAIETDIVILTRNNLEILSEKFPKLATKILWKIAWQLCVRVRQTSGVLIDHIK